MVDCNCPSCAEVRAERDAEWSRILGVEKGKTLTPADAAKWLENDRVQRARNVADARQRRTPPNW